MGKYSLYYSFVSKTLTLFKVTFLSKYKAINSSEYFVQESKVGIHELFNTMAWTCEKSV